MLLEIVLIRYRQGLTATAAVTVFVVYYWTEVELFSGTSFRLEHLTHRKNIF